MNSATKLHLLQELGRRRMRSVFKGYRNPESYGRVVPRTGFVSPYTLGAHNLNSRIVILLQDYASHEYLANRPAPELLTIGRDPCLLTNRRLAYLLHSHFNLELASVFATNLFPFIKKGDMSAGIPFPLQVQAAERFALPQIEAVRPKLVVCLGLQTYNALRVASGSSKVMPLSTAIASPFTLGRARIWCQAHTGSRGQQGRGVEQAFRDWARMARATQ